MAVNTLSVTEDNEGIRTLLTGLVPALLRVAPQHRYRLICSRANVDLFGSVRDQVEYTVLPTARRRPLARIWHDQVTVPRLVHGGTDVLFTPSSVGSVLARVPQVVAVPAHLAVPSLRRAIGVRLSLPHRFYYGPVMRLSHRRAAAVTPISAYLSDQLVLETGLAAVSAEPILLGVDPVPPGQGRNGDGRFALMVATLWPYKNAVAAVDAFALAWPDLGPGFRLVIAGRDPDGRQIPALAARASAKGVGDAVDLLDRVDQAELDRLYGTATMVVLPSLAEGFGLPVLEAMARGVPVIASDRTALPEVLGDAGLLVNPEAPAELARRMVDVATDHRLSERMSAAGRLRASALSWDATARAYVKVFERVGG